MLFLFIPFLPISSLLLPFFLQIRGRLVITDEMLGEGYGPITTASAIPLKKAPVGAKQLFSFAFPPVQNYKLLVFF